MSHPPDPPDEIISVSLPDMDAHAPPAVAQTFSPPPRQLLTTVRSVLRDFNLPASYTMKISYAQDKQRDDYGTLVLETPDGERFGFGAALNSNSASLLLEVARGLQENLPELTATWSEAHPPCPGHLHPAEPIILHGIARWICPATGAIIGQLGSLK